MLALIPLTEFGAKFFYQKLYETCMSNEHYMEDPQNKTITVLEELFWVTSEVLISRGEPDVFNPSKTLTKKSKHYVSHLLHDLCWREQTTVNNIVLLHLNRSGKLLFHFQSPHWSSPQEPDLSSMLPTVYRKLQGEPVR